MTFPSSNDERMRACGTGCRVVTSWHSQTCVQVSRDSPACCSNPSKSAFGEPGRISPCRSAWLPIVLRFVDLHVAHDFGSPLPVRQIQTLADWIARDGALDPDRTRAPSVLPALREMGGTACSFLGRIHCSGDACKSSAFFLVPNEGHILSTWNLALS